MKKKKIIFIGGHHNSALVVAENLKKKGYQIFWFGHKHTMRGEKSLSLELKEVRKAKIDFIELKTGKFHKTYNPLELLKIIYGFFQSLYLLIKIRPQLIISFGGYLSFPVVLAGFLLRIKTIIHEQTTRAGLANRVLALFAKKVLLTWPSSQRFFLQKKTEVIGLPLNNYLFDKKTPKFPFKERLPVILITGGKQGSNVINKAVEANLEKWLEKFNLIHQTGGILKTGDYQRLKEKRKSLSKELRERYILRKFFYARQMVDAVELADVLISRSGAHIVYELAALAKPAILVPLPWAYNNEQLVNAQMLAREGGALILPQRKLNPNELNQKLNHLVNNLNQFRIKSKRFKKLIKKDASFKMVEIIEKII